MLISPAFYREVFSGLVGAAGPYEAAIGAGEGHYGLSGVDKYTCPVVGYESGPIVPPRMAPNRLEESDLTGHTPIATAMQVLVDCIIGKCSICSGDTSRSAKGKA